MDIGDAREKIGQLWGLGRAITKSELARALKLSPEHGGDFVARIEKGTASMTGPTEVAIQAFLDGYSPRHMDAIVKSSYPRGPAR